MGVVVCLSRPMEGGDSNFQFFVELPVPPQSVGVVGKLNYCVFSLYHSGIRITTLSFLDLKDVILFL